MRAYRAGALLNKIITGAGDNFFTWPAQYPANQMLLTTLYIVSMSMDSINTSEEYATLFVNHDNRLSQKAEAFVKAQNKFVNVINVKHQRITPTQLIEMVRNCNVEMNQLFDRSSDFYQEKVKHTRNFDEAVLADMLTKQPELLRTPFVVIGNTMKFFETSKDLTLKKEVND